MIASVDMEAQMDAAVTFVLMVCAVAQNTCDPLLWSSALTEVRCQQAADAYRGTFMDQVGDIYFRCDPQLETNPQLENYPQK